MGKLVILGSLIITVSVILFLIFENNEVAENLDVSLNPTQEITIGTIHRDAAKMTTRYQPMADYIAKKLSDDTTTYVGRVNIPNTQEKMIDAIDNQNIDIYFDSPLIGMSISQETKLTPILYAWKEGVKSYNTVFIAPKYSDIASLEELKGKTAIFEDSESTSGYLLPIYHLGKMGYSVGNEPSSDIFYKFSLDDENTPIWVIEGRGDFGAFSNIDFEDLPINIKNELKIIGTTEEIPRQIVFFRDNLDIEDELLRIFLEMESMGTQELDSSKISKFSTLNNTRDLSQVKKMLLES